MNPTLKWKNKKLQIKIGKYKTTIKNTNIFQSINDIQEIHKILGYNDKYTIKYIKWVDKNWDILEPLYIHGYEIEIINFFKNFFKCKEVIENGGEVG